MEFDRLIRHYVSAGKAEEDETFQNGYYPIFVVLESCVVAFLWLGYAVALGGAGWTTTWGGLDSIFPGKTLVATHSDCQSRRWEAWRWLTYQWTHAGLAHAGLNCLWNLVVGIPLEGFHGHARTALVFNLGTFAGAMFHMVYSAHPSLAGCSSGSYSLMGMHMGDLFLNWSETRYRIPKLVVLLVLVAVDILGMQLMGHSSTSYAAHIGGYTTGLCAGAVLGRNLVVRRHERVVQVILTLIFLGSIIFALCWISQWAPRSLKDPTPWCWARQVMNSTFFGDFNYHCVRCPDQACINMWSGSEDMHQVDWQLCGDIGWGYSG